MALAALALSFAFGAVDQYLGSLWSATHIGFWAIDVSQLSALWLALPFVFGARQPVPARAAVSGAAVTLAALVGYFVMTLSPAEGVNSEQINLSRFAHSQLHVILPALLTGPFYGWLGWRWRTLHSWRSAALVAGAFLLEPMARLLIGQPFRSSVVSVAEATLGTVILGLVFAERRWTNAAGC